MMKKVEIIYNKGESDKFMTEQGHEDINRFAEMQAKIKKTKVKNIIVKMES